MEAVWDEVTRALKRQLLRQPIPIGLQGFRMHKKSILVLVACM